MIFFYVSETNDENKKNECIINKEKREERGLGLRRNAFI